jgi:hypothetical protein
MICRPVLPHGRRHAEARRMLALPAVAAETTARLRCTAFLPYAEVVGVLDEATRSAEAEERAYAYELLVRCAARTGDPTAVTDLLAGLKRIRNEQDPVRSRLLMALAEIRPDLFETAAVGALDGLVRDALDARDCSWQSSNAVVRLVFRVLWQSVAVHDRQPLALWALETLERIGGWRRTPVPVDLRRVLRRGQEHAVFDRLRQRFSDGVRRNDAWSLLVFARSLGKRGWHLPGLQELIGRAAKGSSDAVVTSAVALWLAPPRGRAEKVAQLVDHDEVDADSAGGAGGGVAPQHRPDRQVCPGGPVPARAVRHGEGMVAADCGSAGAGVVDARPGRPVRRPGTPGCVRHRAGPVAAGGAGSYRRRVAWMRAVHGGRTDHR